LTRKTLCKILGSFSV